MAELSDAEAVAIGKVESNTFFTPLQKALGKAAIKEFLRRLYGDELVIVPIPSDPIYVPMTSCGCQEYPIPCQLKELDFVGQTSRS